MKEQPTLAEKLERLAFLLEKLKEKEKAASPDAATEDKHGFTRQQP